MKKVNNQPLVNVVMTAYNAEAFIAEALQSIVNQSYKNLEIIVVDDNSQDKTWKIIKEFKKGDRRIKAYRLDKNGGPSVASNFGIGKARGKYLARMDADDISYKDRIKKQVEFMEKHPEVVMLSGQCDIIDGSGNLIGKKTFPTTHEKISEALFMNNPIKHPACMARKSVYIRAKIRYEKQYFVSHDLKILFRLLDYGKLANLPGTILQYRNRPNSITHKNPKRTFKETVKIRHWALKYGYRPTFKGLTVHILECVLVAILPNKAINSLFNFWRVKKAVTAPLKTAYRLALEPLLFLLVLLKSK